MYFSIRKCFLTVVLVVGFRGRCILSSREPTEQI